MEEKENNEYLYYPPKPKLASPETSRKDAINRSLFSMALFIAFFYFFFDVDLRLILVVVAALIIHELGHFFVMERFGYKDLKIFFVPLLGAYVSGENENISQKEKSIVYLAGPIPGILLGLMFLAFYWRTGTENFLLLSSVFIYINAFNLLPVNPLDGGKFIESMFFEKNGIIQIIFMSISVIAIIGVSIYLELFIFLVFGILMGGKVYSRIEILKIRKALSNAGFVLNKTYEELSDEEYWQMRDIVIRQSPFYKKVKKGVFAYSEREPLIINHLTNVLQRVPVKNLSVFQKVVFLLIWAAFLASPMVFYLFSDNSLVLF